MDFHCDPEDWCRYRELGLYSTRKVGQSLPSTLSFRSQCCLGRDVERVCRRGPTISGGRPISVAASRSADTARSDRRGRGAAEQRDELASFLSIELHPIRISPRAFHHSTNIGSGIDFIDDLEVGENLPRRKLFDFLLVQAVEPIKERPTRPQTVLDAFFGARHGNSTCFG